MVTDNLIISDLNIGIHNLKCTKCFSTYQTYIHMLELDRMSLSPHDESCELDTAFGDILAASLENYSTLLVRKIKICEKHYSITLHM